MILLLGQHGYIGSAFAAELDRRGIEWSPVSYETVWYETFSPSSEVDLVINAAACIPTPSVAACNKLQGKTIRGNVILPVLLTQKCCEAQIPLAHLSTACLWTDGQEHSEDDLSQRAFTGYCGFYIGTKLLAEEEVRNWEKHYIWRIPLIFDEFDGERNYLSKLAGFSEVWDETNSLCHRQDLVKACLDMWELKAPFGTYSVCNPGSYSAHTLALELWNRRMTTSLPKTVRGNGSGAILSVKKLLSTGVKIRPVEEAVEESLTRWVKAV